MNSLFSRRRFREPGWLAVAMQPGGLSFPHGISKPGEPCVITRRGSRPFEDPPQEVERMAKGPGAGRHQCPAGLTPSEYHLLLVHAAHLAPLQLPEDMSLPAQD